MDKIARIWDLQGRLIAEIKGHTDIVDSVRFSPDNRLLATAGWDNAVGLWEVASGKPVRRILGHTDGVYDATFSPDGARLATCSMDRTARVWEVATGKEIPPAMRHGDVVREVRFSPDGRLLATVAGDRTLRLWQADTHLPVEGTSLLRNSDRTICVAFDPEGRRIAAGAQDGAFRVWDLAGGNAGAERFESAGLGGDLRGQVRGERVGPCAACARTTCDGSRPRRLKDRSKNASAATAGGSRPNGATRTGSPGSACWMGAREKMLAHR